MQILHRRHHTVFDRVREILGLATQLTVGNLEVLRRLLILVHGVDNNVALIAGRFSDLVRNLSHHTKRTLTGVS